MGSGQQALRRGVGPTSKLAETAGVAGESPEEFGGVGVWVWGAATRAPALRSMLPFVVD
jgi:hypothetical protein